MSNIEIKKPLVKKLQSLSNLNDTDIIAIHNDYKLHNANDLKQRDTNINDIKDFEDLRGFIKYTKTYKSDATAVFVNSKRILASFDYHKPNLSNFDKHHAVYNLVPNQRFQHWLGNQNKWFGQKEFSDFLDSGLNEVVAPTQSDLINLIRNLRATTKYDVDFKQEAGLAHISYSSTTKVHSIDKQSVTIPEYFEIACLPYKGLTAINATLDEKLHIPTYQTKVKLAFRTSEEGSKLEFKYTVLADQKLIEETQEAIKTLISGAITETEIYIGG